MGGLLKISGLVDTLNEWIGKLIMWLILAAVLISTGNAVMRKAFDIGSNAYLEIQWYLFAAVFMLGAGYVFLHDQHVRIDIVSSRLKRKTQVLIDVIGIALFLIPLCLVVAYMALPSVMLAYNTNEVSANPGGLTRWPLYVLVPIGFVLLAVQALSELIKRVAFLMGRAPDPHAKPEKTDEEMLLEELQRELAAEEAKKGAAK